MTGQQERQTCLYSRLRTSFKHVYVNAHVGQLGRHGNGTVCRHILSFLQTLITKQRPYITVADQPRGLVVTVSDF